LRGGVQVTRGGKMAEYKEEAKIHRLTCRRCQAAKRVGNWRCRVCNLLVCEHFCGFKKPDGTATCVRCTR
jgi:hypothetical protein